MHKIQRDYLPSRINYFQKEKKKGNELSLVPIICQELLILVNLIRNSDSERISNLPEVTQLISGGPAFKPKSDWIQKEHKTSFYYFILSFQSYHSFHHFLGYHTC